jgi:hypothetical protein
LADRTLRAEFEPVLCLEAPEPVPVPRGLLREDGRSVYRRHGGTRFAMRAQLSLEEAMTAQAAAEGAPRMTRAAAAHALGVDLARLESLLAGGAGLSGRADTASGLREDQAAAALSRSCQQPSRQCRRARKSWPPSTAHSSPSLRNCQIGSPPSARLRPLTGAGPSLP